MHNSGYYDQAFTWLIRIPTKNEDDGQIVEDFTENGTLWGHLELTNGTEQDEYGALMSVAQGQVILRQFPTITALDRIKHKHFDEMYVIQGVFKNLRTNETILDIKHYDGQTNLVEDGDFLLLEDDELIEGD